MNNKENVVACRVDSETKKKLEKLKNEFEEKIGIKVTMSQYIDYLIKKHIEQRS